MSDMMTFPATVEEFMEQYKIVDDEKVYTNGADLVPIFRMMQWFEHVSATDKNVGTTISRQQAIDALKELTANGTNKGMISGEDAVHRIEMLPPAQPIDDIHREKEQAYYCGYEDGAKAARKEQRTDLLKAEIKRMKRSFTTCPNSDYYTGYMSALSAVEGYIAEWEGDAE